jgi:sigma-B regulation protein RsbU (phosphoserine phosphatase)
VVWLRNMVSVKRGPDGQAHTLRGVIVDITQLDKNDVEMAAVHWREHRISETLQRSMLLKLDEDPFPSLEIATFYEPCWDEAQVGGDFFDFFVPSPGKVALVVGDVCGKGLAAAARTVEVKYALRAYMHDEEPPAALSHLNRYLAAEMAVDGEDEEFVALCLAVVDQVSGEVTFVSAGAEPPMILQSGNDALPVDVGGIPLGITLDSTYEATVLHLSPGETLLMATDGLTEARSGNLFLGPEGVAQMARDALPMALKPMGQTVLDGARSFAQGKFRDDVCMLIARRR